MFSAVFLATFAEGVDEAAQDQFTAKAKAAAAAVSPVFLADKVFEPKMPGGDFVCEVGFADQAAYEAAKGTEAWAALKALFADRSTIANCEFVAYGEGTLTLQDTENSTCHRILIFSLRDGADPAMVEKMEAVMNDMTDHVPGLRNCKFARVVESEGTDRWAYAYECDFDHMGSFLGKYMTTPFHFLYIDKFFEPAAGEWVANTNLCTPYFPQDKPFLANFA